MRAARDKGHEVGIHCYDHIRWQDGLATMQRDEVYEEFGRARAEFERIFGSRARTAGAAGWQANAISLAAYDDADLLYASDSRGTSPFFPRSDGIVFKTLQIPTTLPTMDELLGRPDYPRERIPEQYATLLKPGALNVLTIHAEIEGMKQIDLFRSFLGRIAGSVEIVQLDSYACGLLKNRGSIPVCDLVPGTVDGRSGTLAVQH